MPVSTLIMSPWLAHMAIYLYQHVSFYMGSQCRGETYLCEHEVESHWKCMLLNMFMFVGSIFLFLNLVEFSSFQYVSDCAVD
jgi:hypothetical protein